MAVMNFTFDSQMMSYNSSTPIDNSRHDDIDIRRSSRETNNLNPSINNIDFKFEDNANIN